MNLALLLGNLTRDPEARLTPSGVMVVGFSVATNKKVKGEEYTQYHNIVVWGNGPGENGQAGACNEFLRKGSKVLVRGEIQTRSWEDKEGTKRYTTEIVAEKFGGVTFLDGRRNGNGGEQHQEQEAAAAVPPDDIPF